MAAASVLPTGARQATAFDRYAEQYEAALNDGLRLVGEGPEYFARRRLEWTARITGCHSPTETVLDFGCGIGLAVPLIKELLTPTTVWGFDPSLPAVERAQAALGDAQTHFTPVVDDLPPEQFDLAYCNGVFHHIEPRDRAAALAVVRRALCPGGWFAFWENNPWNPGTRYVMNRIPFDRDAQVISPPKARLMLRSAGFEIIRSYSLFLFPRSLRLLRPLERWMCQLPLGGQYLVLARKT